jgi:Homeodomain-like domain
MVMTSFNKLYKAWSMGQHQKNIVHLTAKERDFLIQQTRIGQWKPREVIRAQILLLADVNGPNALEDKEICARLGCSKPAVVMRRKRFAQTQSIEDTIFDTYRSGRPTIVDGAVEAHITKIACSHPPKGNAQWSLRLIRDRVVSLEVIDDISASTVGRILKKKKSSLG